MSDFPKYIAGEPYSLCDGCGWKMRAKDLRKTWDGFMMCQPDWYEKHAQLRQIPSFPSKGRMINNSRPESQDIYLSGTTNTLANNGL